MGIFSMLFLAVLILVVVYAIVAYNHLVNLKCWVPCDHVPVRGWPLFRARQLMRDVIESFKQDQAL